MKYIEKETKMKKTNASAINIPNWLVGLPAGDYCVSQLSEQFKLTYHTVYQRLQALGVPNYKKEVNLGLGVNKSLIFYIWEGFEEESKKINALRVEKLFEEESKKINALRVKKLTVIKEAK